MLDEVNAQPGEFILQSAAASALGKALIQFAKIMGMKTINIVRREEQKEELKAIGADFVINSETEDIKKVIAEITEQKGVRCAFDAVTGTTGSAMADSLGKKGIMLIYGRLSKEPFSPAPAAMLFKQSTVRGFWLQPWKEENPQKTKEFLGKIIKLLLEKKIKFDAKTFDAATQFQEAIEHSVAPGKSEKSVLVF
eukprot:TRINITY_DN2827_c0_g1_i3.p1 TRINITY_DN2827_c0_g1~~TRINITY_DN2827_c0_g1_i3.p1  ORF type:complete len:195 (-),score=67.93 TRINITY_DN2827_c0_g1_i3:23-607(-)